MAILFRYGMTTGRYIVTDAFITWALRRILITMLIVYIMVFRA